MKNWIKRHKILAAVLALVGLAVLYGSWGWTAYPRGMLEAQIDWWRGQPELKVYGDVRPPGQRDEILQEEYGVKLNRVAGCIVPRALAAYADGYNAVIRHHLHNRYGENILKRWREGPGPTHRTKTGHFEKGGACQMQNGIVLMRPLVRLRSILRVTDPEHTGC